MHEHHGGEYEPARRRERRTGGHRPAWPLLIGGRRPRRLGAAALARDELARLWWRLPGVEKPRKEGEVDYAGAQWVAASDANLRRADRPADYGIDRVVVHVTQGSFAAR